MKWKYFILELTLENIQLNNCIESNRIRPLLIMMASLLGFLNYRHQFLENYTSFMGIHVTMVILGVSTVNIVPWYIGLRKLEINNSRICASLCDSKKISNYKFYSKDNLFWYCRNRVQWKQKKDSITVYHQAFKHLLSGNLITWALTVKVSIGLYHAYR